MLADIPGVGPSLQATLKRYGLASVRDALRVDAATLAGWLGPRSGRWLYERLRGEAGDRLDPGSAARSMSHEETFARDLVSDDALETRLLRLVTALTAELRAEGLSAGRVTLKLRDHDFRTRSASRTLLAPLRTDRPLFEVARELLATLRSRRRTAARLLGVAYTELTAEAGPPQLDLLGHPRAESSRDQRLAGAVDRINSKLGGKLIRPARLVGTTGRSGDAK
jgi:DNA polymerase-4